MVSDLIADVYFTKGRINKMTNDELNKALAFYAINLSSINANYPLSSLQILMEREHVEECEPLINSRRDPDLEKELQVVYQALDALQGRVILEKHETVPKQRLVYATAVVESTVSQQKEKKTGFLRYLGKN